ncbi:Probable voltage-dependent R-type calcium channel subunit alpha-1E (DOE-1) (Voltage-gated calcium channel subunit alpha Cav2.3) [Durusdinium trenchii]|uniref:Probable voltage-dependent R-type calcium channel subunit alpha-1E (DOE-1) (Voltage-gated calcium channel subunit alpha Cav2.3) n=1 Tax=Durusdinium trenchii TaxID=1381693 RepID=A0ABP0PWR1_9DINO
MTAAVQLGEEEFHVSLSQQKQQLLRLCAEHQLAWQATLNQAFAKLERSSGTNKSAPGSPRGVAAKGDSQTALSSLISRQEAVTEKLESQERTIRWMIDALSEAQEEVEAELPSLLELKSFDVNELPPGHEQTWQRCTSKDSKESQLPASYTLEEFQLKQEAMTATGSLQRKRYSERRVEVQEKSGSSSIARQMDRVAGMIQHPLFESTMTIIVALNAVFIGIDTENSLQREGVRPIELQVTNMTFALIFLVELLLRITGTGRWFLCDENWMWNWLDVAIVFASLWDVTLDILQMCNLAGDAESIAGITGLKVFRFIRVTRILKTIQFVRILRFFMALRTLVTSIFSTVKSLVWALLLLGLIVYIFAVIFVQVVNDYMDSAHSVTEEVQSLSQRHFSSLTSCMLSLFMSIAGGVSWQEVLEPVKEVSTWWVFLFLFFISFTEFAVLNVVTGVFCQSAIESASHDQAHMMQSMMQNKETHLNKIKDLFAKMGAHESGCITFSMFEDKINDPDVRAFFESLDLDIWDAWTFFKLLDTDGGGMVEVEEFFMGCLRFRGTARSMDVAKLIQDQRWLIHHLSSFEAFMESELNCVKEELVQLGQSVRPSYKKILPRLGSRMRDL